MVGKFWPHFYHASIRFPWTPVTAVSKLFMGDLFHFRYPHTYRQEDIERNTRIRAGVGNGMIGIKYYPIDMYEFRYGRSTQELEDAIGAGRLLNDIVFWHTAGLVESWSKDRTTIDRKNQTIMGPTGKTVAYDILVDGSARERPNLPPITIHDKSGHKHDYCYQYRDSYLGVVPKRLKNIFFLGYTRPTTGGAANIVEMQGLLVHRLLTQPTFKQDIYNSLEERLQKYNDFYYPRQSTTTPTDHLVFYGLYTQEIAECMGIHRPVWKNAWSWNPRDLFLNLRFEVLTPNNAFKYRLSGEHKIPGAQEMAWSIFEYLEHFALMTYSFVCLVSDMLLGYQCFFMIFLRYAWQPWIEHSVGRGENWYQPFAMLFQRCARQPWMEHYVGGDEKASIEDDAMVVNFMSVTVLLLLCTKLWYDNLGTVFLQVLSMPVLLVGLRAHCQPLFMCYVAWKGEWYWCPAMFCSQILINVLSRQFFAFPFNGRYVFGDCKYKHKYRGFYEKYKEAYMKVKKIK